MWTERYPAGLQAPNLHTPAQLSTHLGGHHIQLERERPAGERVFELMPDPLFGPMRARGAHQPPKAQLRQAALTITDLRETRDPRATLVAIPCRDKELAKGWRPAPRL